ncbi:MAG: ribosome biogenesis GTPase Der [Gemmataceae bacterium]
MPIPQIVIVGRPNVGKSSLLNWLAGRRIAIVDPTAGVTRDRIATPIEVRQRVVDLVDTGGMGIQDVDNLTEDVERQIQRALLQADVILFLVDNRAGCVPLDEVVAERLRPFPKPVVLVANKCDQPEMETQAAEFFRLGHGQPLCVSTLQNRNKQALLDRIAQHLPEETSPEVPPEVDMKLAIVGRRNTGKSTFINALAQSERVIVSEIPGTTRDSVDVRFERDGKAFIAIDTAGVRYKGSITGDIEFYSLARAERSIRRADVVLHFLDSRLKISRVDKQLVQYVLEEHKPVIFVVNKWDLAKDHVATETFADYVHKMFPMLDFVPVAFISAQMNKNVQTLLNLAQNLFKQAQARISTGELNRVIQSALTRQAPPLRSNRRPKIYFGTQVASQPPTIVLFTNGPELFDNTYQRYLLNTFRDQLPFHEIPIKLYLRAKQRDEGGRTGDEDDRPAEPKTATQPKKPQERKKPPRKQAAKPPASQLWDDV